LDFYIKHQIMELMPCCRGIITNYSDFLFFRGDHSQNIFQVSIYFANMPTNALRKTKLWY